MPTEPAQSAESGRGYDSEAARYERWSKLCADPTICNSNAFSAVVWGYEDVDPHIDWVCRKDAFDNGHCYCGKVLKCDCQCHAEGGPMSQCCTHPERFWPEQFDGPEGGSDA